MRYKKPTLISIVFFSLIIAIMGFTDFKRESKEEKFWNWFVDNQEIYFKETTNIELREKIYDDLINNLKKVNADLVFEFSPVNKNGVREFTISADGILDLFPIVESLIKKAPKHKNWKFNAFRQRIPGDEFEIQYNDFKIGYSDIYFKSENDNGKLGIELHIKDFNGKAQSKNAIYIVLDNLIGEYDVTTKIGYIEWLKLDEKNSQHLKPIIELRKIVDKNKK